MTTLQTLSSAVKVATDAATTATGQANIATLARKATEKAATDVGVTAGAVAAAATVAVAINNRIYPGLYGADPVTRPDGSAIVDGDVCSLASGVMRVRIAGVWQDWTTASGAAAAASADAAMLAEGFAEDWAALTAGDVDGAGGYSAKEYAQGAQAGTGGSAKNWAQQTGAVVTGAAAGSRSAKSWSQDDLTPGAGNLGGSAKDWAQSGGLPDGVNKSAKGFAADAKASRDAIDGRIYPGAYAADPATRPDGTARQNGDLYFNSVGNVVKAYNAGVWSIAPGVAGADIANAADAAKGGSLVGFSRALTYVAGNTVARELMRARGADVQAVGAGDSIMSGLTAPNTVTILTALQAYDARYALATYTNDGVAGSRLDSTVTGAAASGADMVVRYAANVYPKRPAASGSIRSVLVIDIGANDFPIMTAAQVATWITAFENYCATARADGFYVVAYTIMARTGGGNISELAEDNRKRMNDAIRRSLNVDGYVDAAALLPDTTNVTYFIDGTHPTDAGNRLLARALARVLAALGLEVPTATLPATNGAPVVTPAMNAILDAACVEGSATAALTQSLAASVPAVANGDYTVEAWWFQAAGAFAVQPFLDSATSSFGVFGGAAGYLGLYVTPGAAANWSVPRATSGFWNHGLISRAAGVVTFYQNGVNIGSLADANNHTAMTRMFWPVNSKLARVRMYNRALSAAEAKASYNNLSEYNAGEANYIFAMDDGHRSTGLFVEDLSGSKAHILLTDATRVRIKRPAVRGVIKRQSVGSQVIGSIAAGYRITSWTADVTVSGGGNANFGDTNGGGEFMPNTVLTVGKKVIAPVTPFTLSGSIYVNAVGYTINHTICVEKLG